MKNITRPITQNIYLSQGLVIKKDTIVELISVRLDNSFGSGIAVAISTKIGDRVIVETIDSGYFTEK